MADIFVSYSRLDRKRVSQVVHALESEGWSVWWDQSIVAGEPFRGAVEEALKQAGCVLVAWSKNSVGSPWVLDEAQYAAEHNVLIPIILDESTPPIGFQQIQSVALHDTRELKDSPSFERVTAGMRKLLYRGTSARAVAAQSVKADRDEDRAASFRPTLSALAITETVSLTLASVYLAGLVDSVVHIAVGAAIAPFLLLRSRKSTEMGVRLFTSVTLKLGALFSEQTAIMSIFPAADPEFKEIVRSIVYFRGRSKRKLPGYFFWARGDRALRIPDKQFYIVRVDRLIALSVIYALVFIYLTICALGIRVVATLRYPVEGLRQLPENWKRAVLCTDIRHAPEFVPGSGTVSATIANIVGVNETAIGWLAVVSLVGGAAIPTLLVWGFARHDLLWLGVILLLPWLPAVPVFFAGLFASASYVLTMLYRYSLKSTAVVWLPLIYAVHATYDDSLPLEAKLKEIRSAAVWRMIRVVSWLILVAMTLKVTVFHQDVNFWSRSWADVLHIYIMPGNIDLWHIAGTANAMIALAGFYLFLDQAPRRLRWGYWTHSQVVDRLRIFTFLRYVLSFFTIAAGIRLTLHAMGSTG